MNTVAKAIKLMLTEKGRHSKHGSKWLDLDWRLINLFFSQWINFNNSGLSRITVGASKINMLNFDFTHTLTYKNLKIGLALINVYCYGQNKCSDFLQRIFLFTMKKRVKYERCMEQHQYKLLLHFSLKGRQIVPLWRHPNIFKHKGTYWKPQFWSIVNV